MEVKVVYYATSHLFKTNNLMVPAFQAAFLSFNGTESKQLARKQERLRSRGESSG